MYRPMLCKSTLFTALLVPVLAFADHHQNDEGKDGKEQAEQSAMEGTQKSRDALMESRQRTPAEANRGIDRALEESRTGFDRSTSSLEGNRPSVSPDMRSGGRAASGMSGGAAAGRGAGR